MPAWWNLISLLLFKVGAEQSGLRHCFCKREKNLYWGGKTICKLHVTFYNGGNQTQAACAASECATHYSIAFRQPGHLKNKLNDFLKMSGSNAAEAAARTSCSRVSQCWRRPSGWRWWRPSGRARTSSLTEASSSRWVSNPDLLLQRSQLGHPIGRS